MATKRKTIENEGAAVKPARNEMAGESQPLLVAMPRTWFITLVAVFVAPWLIAAALYGWRMRGGGEATGASAEAETESAAAGQMKPWGQLDVTPIVISPPIEYVPNNWGPIEPSQWRFPGTSRQQLEQFLSSVGLSSQQVNQLLNATRFEERIQGLVVMADAELVRKLPPQVRAAIYLQLAKTPLNDRQQNAYRYYGSSAKDWLGQSRISERTLRLVEPFTYQVGDFVYFSDIDLVRRELGDGEELQRLAKALLRESTLLVRLRITNAAKVNDIAEYWGRGGRRTDIRPLLESIAAAGPSRSIDISHLLPTMARQHLYRYPQISLKDLDKGALVNCFWTALNFFNAEPDDRLLNAKFAIDQLKSEYYIVHDNFQLGDIVAFTDADGQYFHATVHLADNLVFGKNGTSSLSPWTIIPLDRLKGYYIDRADGWSINYYRRKGI